MKRNEFILWIGLFIAIGLFFQNCAKSSMVVELASESQAPTKINFQSTPACIFNGQALNENESVVAYLNSTPEMTNGCVSEIRSCQNGVLSGSFTYASCHTGPRSCLFNGITVESGSVIMAYSAPTNSICTSEVRTCNDGLLAGSLPDSSCQIKVCSLNGVTVHSGQSVSYYLKSDNCQPHAGTCNSEGQLLDISSESIVTGAWGDANACTQAPTTSSSGASTDIGTNTSSGNSTTSGNSSSGGSLPEGFHYCYWKGRQLTPGQSFQYYYYSTGTTRYPWMCRAYQGFCLSDGSLRSSYYQGLNGNQIYDSCTLIQDPDDSTSAL